MSYWDTGEWQVVEERLDDLEKEHVSYNPTRECLFSSLDAVPFDSCRVAIMGQDPYPNSKHAMGLAFSVPKSVKLLPPTLNNILKEYCDDLHYPEPKSGDLSKWCEQGVLLWNCIPSCETSKSLSHNWEEWKLLTREIIERQSARGIVFVFLGGFAREFSKYVNEKVSKVLVLSHPSPRASRLSYSPFLGSRMFSTVNSMLNEQGLEPVNWRL